MPAQAVASTQASPPALTYDSDDTDSDDDSVTNVQLGIADGQLEDEDEINPLVSRIGGRVAWLPTKNVPPANTATCRHCNTLMELLVQIFAPLEESPYDRTILAWGCARPSCQRKGAGSVRVVRHLQHNARWAARLAKQKIRKDVREERLRRCEEQQRKREHEQVELKKTNPFGQSSAAPTSAGVGSNIFGGAFRGAPGSNSVPAQSAVSSKKAEHSQSGHKDTLNLSSNSDGSDDETEEQDRFSEELAMKTAVKEAISSREDWTSSAPAYRPPLYLNTVPEASSLARAGERASDAKLTAKVDTNLKACGGCTAADATAEELRGLEREAYEHMVLDGIDEILERFIARVSAEGRQVVRYEMGGLPLPFSAQGDVYNVLWPSKAPQVSQTSAPSDRQYDASRVPPCEACGGPRIFEVQLMPNLVNTLRAEKIEGSEKAGAELRSTQNVDKETRKRQELEAALGKRLVASGRPDREPTMDSKLGLIWSTALIFVCEQDCCIPRDGVTGETWREEWVGLQFED